MTDPTANIVAARCAQNRDYISLWIQPKGEVGRKVRISVGAASVLIAEMAGALAAQVSA